MTQINLDQCIASPQKTLSSLLQKRLSVITVNRQTMGIKNCLFLAIIIVTIGFVFTAAPLFAENQASEEIRKVSLDQAIQEALENNHRRPASRFAVAMAEARHRQALSSYWPQVSVQAGWQLMDESPNFILPASSFPVPATTLPLPPGTSITLNTPAGPQPMREILIPPHNVAIPAQDMKQADRESALASLQAKWLLYDGGMRRGYIEQSSASMDMMKQESRRTDLEIIDSVKRYYFGAVLARQLHQLGMDTLARMETTLELTEILYKEGSGQVKKTDWLGTKVFVESIRSMVADLEKNTHLSQAALANAMGLSWDASVCPETDTIPFEPFTIPLKNLVSTAYQFNPDWVKLEAAIKAAKGAVTTAKSNHYPKMVMTGKLSKWWNDQNSGQATETNKTSWEIGLGVELPLFNGFLTSNQVAESQARKTMLEEQQILFKEGLGLQIRDIFLSLTATAKGQQADQAAMKASIENRKLNTKAYQHSLVKTEDVITAQLMEALMSANYYKSNYDYIALQSRLNLIVGTKILNALEEK